MLNAQRLELKHIDDKGNFAGYASVFGVVDNQNDMMLEGAFAATLLDGKHNVKLLWQHNMDEPIGVFTLLREDARGLYVEGRLLLEVQRAKEAHALLKAGAIAGLSIGYVPVRYRIDPLTGVRLLEEVALYEISLVTFPANAEANVHAVKQEETSLLRSGELIRLSDAIDEAIAVISR
ncbi:MAG: HK97 family phage prohead protease [Alphaproteobacteria bacterium]|nr:HK97 family phage prohead protease [Alphaproteobacteria bacterium]